MALIVAWLVARSVVTGQPCTAWLPPTRCRPFDLVAHVYSAIWAFERATRRLEAPS
jgi:hypothetical protein